VILPPPRTGPDDIVIPPRGGPPRSAFDAVGAQSDVFFRGFLALMQVPGSRITLATFLQQSRQPGSRGKLIREVQACAQESRGRVVESTNHRMSPAG